MTWRIYPEAPAYEVSDRGEVRNTRTGNLLNGSPAVRGGYIAYGLWNAGKQLRRTGHSMVMRAFVGERPEGMQIRHLDGDPTNNALSNLAYGSASENRKDSVQHGTHAMVNRTHCPQGHPYNEENTMMSSKGSRLCRTCQREHKARYTEKVSS